MNELLFRMINELIKSPFLDGVMPVFSDKDYVVIPGFLLLILAFHFGRRKTRIAMAAIVVALLIADMGSEKVLKNVFKKPRPYAQLEGVNLHRSGKWQVYDPAWYPLDRRKSFGFPSSHAANVAAVAAALAFLSRRSLAATVPIVLAAGFSRIYTGNHFPGDVLAGYGWGILCGVTATVLCRRIARRLLPNTPEPDPAPLAPERKTFLLLLGLWTFVNFWFIYVSHYDLVGDEAQYWDWSRHLALGYYSKPPMIAYLISALTSAGGNKEWAIRSGAVLLASGSLALVYALTLRIAKSEKAALLAAVITLAMPATWAGAVILTIDPLLVFFWALAMYAFYRAVHGEKNMWLLTGLALGLGMLSKYTILTLFLSFALYLLIVNRNPLRTPGPYLASGIMLLCITGVVYWNIQNDWVSVRHTAAIGADAEKTIGKCIAYFAEYFAGQAGIVVSPILFGLFLWAVIVLFRRFRHDADSAFLFLNFGVLFGFYAIVAFTRPPQANWPVCAYTAAAPALAYVWHMHPRSTHLRRMLTAALVFGLILSTLARSTDLVYIAAIPFTDASHRQDRINLPGFSMDPDKEPTNHMVGGKELGAALSEYLHDDPATDPFIFSDRYTMTAWAAFYTDGHPITYCVNLGDRRYNQYDLWGGWDNLAGKDGLFIRGGDSIKAQYYIQQMVDAGLFERGELLETVEVRRANTLVRTFTISRLTGYTGAQIESGEHAY